MGARISACAPFLSPKFLCCCLFRTHPFSFALPPFTILLSLPGLTARVFPCAYSPNSGSLIILSARHACAWAVLHARHSATSTGSAGRRALSAPQTAGGLAQFRGLSYYGGTT